MLLWHVLPRLTAKKKLLKSFSAENVSRRMVLSWFCRKNYAAEMFGNVI